MTNKISLNRFPRGKKTGLPAIVAPPLALSLLVLPSLTIYPLPPATAADPPLPPHNQQQNPVPLVINHPQAPPPPLSQGGHGGIPVHH